MGPFLDADAGPSGMTSTTKPGAFEFAAFVVSLLFPCGKVSCSLHSDRPQRVCLSVSANVPSAAHPARQPTLICIKV